MELTNYGPLSQPLDAPIGVLRFAEIWQSIRGRQSTNPATGVWMAVVETIICDIGDDGDLYYFRF